MALAAQLNSSTVLTPREREQQKTSQQRAEDVIYTLNHTFTCLSLTDFVIMPIIYGLTGGKLGHKWGHNHATDSACCEVPAVTPRESKMPASLEEEFAKAMAARQQEPKGKGRFQKLLDKEASGSLDSTATEKNLGDFAERKRSILERAGHWFVGEFIGDVGAAFVTIGVQRLMPSVMSGIRYVIEPVFGSLFKRGANRAAHKWADRHGLEYTNQEVVERAEQLYNYEMQHLPQMAVWTASSIGIHYGVMKMFEKEMTVKQFATQKVVGAGITALTVFGVRAFAPDKAHKWDETAGKHVVVPLTKTVGKLFGVKERDVDAYHAARREKDSPQSWAARVGNETPASFVARII